MPLLLLNTFILGTPNAKAVSASTFSDGFIVRGTTGFDEPYGPPFSSFSDPVFMPKWSIEFTYDNQIPDDNTAPVQIGGFTYDPNRTGVYKNLVTEIVSFDISGVSVVDTFGSDFESELLILDDSRLPNSNTLSDVYQLTIREKKFFGEPGRPFMFQIILTGNQDFLPLRASSNLSDLDGFRPSPTRFNISASFRYSGQAFGSDGGFVRGNVVEFVTPDDDVLPFPLLPDDLELRLKTSPESSGLIGILSVGGLFFFGKFKEIRKK